MSKNIKLVLLILLDLLLIFIMGYIVYFDITMILDSISVNSGFVIWIRLGVFALESPIVVSVITIFILTVAKIRRLLKDS